MPPKTILIVDGDLGFVFFLGQMLDAAGFTAVPARSFADATGLVKQFHLEIGLLILNPSLDGGVAFARKVLAAQGQLRTIAIVDGQGGSSVAFPQADAFLERPSVWDEDSRDEWLQTIEHLFGPERDCNASFGVG